MSTATAQAGARASMYGLTGDGPTGSAKGAVHRRRPCIFASVLLTGVEPASGSSAVPLTCKRARRDQVRVHGARNGATGLAATPTPGTGIYFAKARQLPFPVPSRQVATLIQLPRCCSAALPRTICLPAGSWELVKYGRRPTPADLALGVDLLRELVRPSIPPRFIFSAVTLYSSLSCIKPAF